MVFQLLAPAGPIAAQQKTLILTIAGLLLGLALPTLIVFFSVAWKYRANNPNARKYKQKKHKTWHEIFLWVLPVSIIAVLAVINWQSAHAIDPYKPLEATAPDGSAVAPLTIEVVALNWKWLFIYPEQHIATVNFIQFPVNTPLNFVMTADAPMNSFWIPRLGGQMGVMAGMETHLHLMATHLGDYAGSEMEINGPGYAGMQFTARASSQTNFDAWVASVKRSATISSTYPVLTQIEYNNLAAPSENNAPAFYSSVAPDLFNDVMLKYMPSGQMQM